jgi:hypothetical protein
LADERCHTREFLTGNDAEECRSRSVRFYDYAEMTLMLVPTSCGWGANLETTARPLARITLSTAQRETVALIFLCRRRVAECTKATTSPEK